MSKKRFDRSRLQARPKYYKQAGAVEEALRCRGVIAHVKPSWTGSLIVRVAEPDVAAGFLDAHADAMADALLADSVAISGGLRDFIVVPEWRGPDDSDELENEDVWPSTDDPEPAADELAGAPALPDGLRAVEALDAFLHGYKMGRLASVLDDLRRHLVLSGPRADGGYELRLDETCDTAAIRTQLHSRAAALAEALGAAGCRIAGRGRRITITPVPQSVATQGA